jgi:acylphosphatase
MEEGGEIRHRARKESRMAETPDRQIARMVYFSGRVQGVGFRATAAALARDFPVTGWVRNLPDGRVQLLAEGPAEAVKSFLEEVRSRFRGCITREQVEDQTPSGHSRFSVLR